MFLLHHGNRLETLRTRLAEITAVPLREVFAAEQIVVQNPGMARWLTHGLAEQHGIAANLHFSLPASFVWELFRGQFDAVPEQSAFAPEALRWRIHALLPQLLDDAAFSAPRGYLRDDHDARKRLQLATRIAGLFDQYLIYRPELIFAWERGAEPDDWQARLWRALTAELGTRHRAGLLRALRDRAGGLNPAPLPQRVCLFGISALAPAYLDIFQALAEHIDVHVFLLSPSFQWWGDQLAPRDHARRRDAARRLGVRAELVDDEDSGNPLLDSLAGQGREFFTALHERATSDAALYSPPAELSLLGMLQLDVLFLQQRGGGGELPVPFDPHEGSLRVHACHARIREVQVLHDQLLDLFETLPALVPREIVVMAPEIGAYAPLIDAVFGAAPAARRIPWSIADRADLRQAPLIETFLALLQLPRDRLALADVFAWLQCAPLARRFGLADEAALERLRGWLDGAGVRWGRDAAHRREFGIDTADTHTWAFGLRRLLLGYALDDADALVAGIAPYPDIEGKEAEWLGGLAEFIARLDAWRAEFATPAPAAAWPGRLLHLLAQGFDFAHDTAGESLLHGAIAKLREEFELAGALDDAQTRLGHALIHARLRELLAEQSASEGVAHGAFLNGAVSFCNLVPMRSIPFRVVCLLGMNDGEYPREQRSPSFDRIAARPQRGDRSRRDDDRTLFLEALLSARDCLYLSYIGNDARDDSPRNPSVLVSELLDSVERGFGIAPKQMIQRHPLQPFSAANYLAPHFSYAEEWLPAEIAARPFLRGDERLMDPELDTDGIALAELIEFFANPARYFLGKRLGVRLADEASRLADSEDFTLNGLQAWQLRAGGLNQALAGAAFDAAGFEARGMLAHGRFGSAQAAAAAAEVAALHADIAPLLAATRDQTIDATLADGTRLYGRLNHCAPTHMLRFRVGKAKSSARLGVWIEHLARNLQTPSETVWITLDSRERLSPVADAAARLADLADIYREGRRRALALFPTTAEAYVRALAKKDADAALAAVATVWLSGERSRGESDDPSYAFAFRDRDPLHETDPEWGFAPLARRVFAPLLAAWSDAR